MATGHDELTDFRWRRFRAGYEWSSAQPRTLDGGTLDVESQPRPFLISKVPHHEPHSAIEYSPLLKTGLFRTFAQTSVDETGILGFADHYGFLGGRINTALKVPGESFLRFEGEAFESWVWAITELRTMLLIWDAAMNGNLGTLSQCIHWNGAAVFYSYSDEYQLIASNNLNPELLERFTPGDLVLPAKFFLNRRITQQLLANGVGKRLVWSDREAKPVLRDTANSLIGALWLQFAKAIDGDRKYRQCQNCREWMEVGGNRTARSDKKFCTPSCKSASHRRSIVSAKGDGMNE